MHSEHIEIFEEHNRELVMNTMAFPQCIVSNWGHLQHDQYHPFDYQSHDSTINNWSFWVMWFVSVMMNLWKNMHCMFHHMGIVSQEGLARCTWNMFRTSWEILMECCSQTIFLLWPAQDGSGWRNPVVACSAAEWWWWWWCFQWDFCTGCHVGRWSWKTP